MGKHDFPPVVRSAQAGYSQAVNSGVCGTSGETGSPASAPAQSRPFNLDTPSLDEKENETGHGYRAKTFHYPDGGVETVAWAHDPMKEERQSDASREGREARKALREGLAEWVRVTRVRTEDGVRRAKTKVRRLARSMGLDRMLTFTTREQVNSRDELVEDWDRFRRELMKANPDFRYIAVVEPHPSNPGHYHIHVGVRGFHDVNVLRRCWIKVLRRRIKSEGSPGNVQVEKKRGGSPERLAKYLAKYLGKSLEESEVNRKSYWHNRKAGECLRVTRWVPAAESWNELVRELVGDACVSEVRWFNPHPGVLWVAGVVS